MIKYIVIAYMVMLAYIAYEVWRAPTIEGDE